MQHQEVMAQLLSAGIDFYMADLAADAIMADQEGRERTEQEQQAATQVAQNLSERTGEK